MSAPTYHFTPLTDAEARTIAHWHYEPPYDVYNTPEEERDAAVREMLDHRSPYFAVRDETGVLSGFFAYGSSAEVGGYTTPHLMSEDNMLSVGLGLRPDLTGHRQGAAFVAAGLAHARALYHPRSFRLFVLSFNERAMRVYEEVRFVRVGTVSVPFEGGLREFTEMRREA